MVRVARARAGASRIGCLLQLLVLAAIVYVGAIAGEESLNYYRFKDAMKNEARFAATRSDQEIRSRLRAFTDSVKLPPAAKEIRVTRLGNTIRIWSEYDERFDLPLNHTKIVHLRPSVERSF